MSNISEKYKVDKKEVSCPGCGREYGHNNTDVDIISQECRNCSEQMSYEDTEYVSADKYVKEYLGYSIF